MPQLRHFNRLRKTENLSTNLRRKRAWQNEKRALAGHQSAVEYLYRHFESWSVLFGEKSLAEAEALLLRLRRWRRSQARRISTCQLILGPKRKYKNRNYHHLVPKSREGKPVRTNLLLMKVERHTAWHKLFKKGRREMTLDEIVEMLSKLSILEALKKIQAA